MSQSVALEHGVAVEPAESPLTPESWGKLGMWLFLAGDAMSFGSLIAAYAALRIANPDWPNPNTFLGIPLTAVMTFLLICSSVTMVKALDAIKHDDHAGFQKFMLATVLGGSLFLGMQAYEWTHLFESLSMSQLHGATFYAMTGFHGCHVFSGVVYLSVILANGRYYSSHNSNSVEVVGLYWHFVDLVWILIFTFVYLI